MIETKQRDNQFKTDLFQLGLIKAAWYGLLRMSNPRVDLECIGIPNEFGWMLEQSGGTCKILRRNLIGYSIIPERLDFN